VCELSDTMLVLLNNLVDYCKAHDIPLNREQNLWSLINKAQTITEEIRNINSPSFQKLSRRKVTHSKTDEDETEP